MDRVAPPEAVIVPNGRQVARTILAQGNSLQPTPWFEGFIHTGQYDSGAMEKLEQRPTRKRKTRKATICAPDPGNGGPLTWEVPV
jgi:hypothetical protein